MATTIWTLLSILVIAPLGALALDRPLFGNWIWHIDLEGNWIWHIDLEGNWIWHIAPEKVRDDG
jgi:hypothetical protein